MDWALFVVVELGVMGATAFGLLLAFEGIKSAHRSGIEEASPADRERQPHETNGFFVRSRSERRVSQTVAADDLAVLRFEQYLKEESEQAREFVSKPSVASLYRNSERSFTLN